MTMPFQKSHVQRHRVTEWSDWELVSSETWEVSHVMEEGWVLGSEGTKDLGSTLQQTCQYTQDPQPSSFREISTFHF